MSRLTLGVACVLAVACGPKKAEPPELVTRDLPGNGVMAPMRPEPDPGDSRGDGGSEFFDGGCCEVVFTLPALEGEVAAELQIQGFARAMSRSGAAWSVAACVPLASTTYYFTGGLTTDDDAGLLWVPRVSETVAKTRGRTVDEENVFDVGEARECAAFDGGVYGATASDAGSPTDAGPVDSGTADAGNGVPVQTTIAGACDSLTAPTVLLSSDGGSNDVDENSSDTLALPFAFNFFGSAVTHYAGVSNGYLQFFTSPSGIAIPDGANATLPTAGNPDGFVAAFWDDLNSVGTETAVIQAQLFGAAGSRHLTVEWKNWAQGGATSPARLTFQVKLFETTHAIELHYCALDANGATAQFERGASATVGVENLAGTVGVQYSHNQPTLSTTSGLRYR